MTNFIKYPAKIEKEGKAYNITFPDFPEAISCGYSFEEAVKMAEDCLETIILHRIKSQEKIPMPSKNKKYELISLDPLTASKLFLYREMKDKKVKKADLARKMKVNQKQIDRLLDVSHHSTISQLEKALSVLGKRLLVGVENIAIP